MKKLSTLIKKFSILNSQFSIPKGFTLVELLVAIVVIGSFGTIVLNIITSAFRGTSKTNVINTVRENGNYAISQMSRTIRYAKTFDGDCQIMPQPPAPTPTPIQYSFVTVTTFDEGPITFACGPNTITSNGVSLMDAGPSGVVSISPGTCFFTCRKASILDSPTIGINFTLTSIITSGIVEKQSTIPFNTSIKIRN